MSRPATLSDFSELPRWGIRSVIWAVVVTGGMYLLLPYMETMSGATEQAVELRSVNTVDLPPPPPPPVRLEAQQRPQDVAPDLPKPKLNVAPPKLAPLQVAMDLNVGFTLPPLDLEADFTVTPSVGPPAPAGDAVYTLNELDASPRPLARLNPIYPVQARMRKLEGHVVVEFVVNEEGRTEELLVVESVPGDVFVKPATRAIERWRFAPGTLEGKPVATRVRQKVNFSLR